MLKQETHLDPQSIHLIEAETRNLLPLNADRTSIRIVESDDEPQQHALPRAASAEHGERLTVNDRQTDAVQDMLCAKRLVDVSKHQDRLARPAGRLLSWLSGLSWKKIRINLTRMTSARITNSDDKTTALVAERPTPSVPPCVRMP